MRVPIVDLHAQYADLKRDIDDALAHVLESGWYILGEQVSAFENEFAAYCKTAACIGVNSGTDALQLALMACGVGPGDEVITVAHTAVATAAAISLTGARPVFVDIDPDTYTLDPDMLTAAVSPTTKAIIPVHIYGHPADLQPILQVAQAAGLYVIEDCAQAHGATYDNKPVGSIGHLGCFSFYPTKNLGAMGDGGAVVGNDRELTERVRLLREYGWSAHSRYVSKERGLNSRLDEMQAAILRVKLKRLDRWNEARRRWARHYAENLPASLHLPIERNNCRHVFHLYVVRVPNRDQFRRDLQTAGIGTGIHYPVPIHLQPAYADAATSPLLQTERVAPAIVSLPMHPLLTRAEAKRVEVAVAEALAR